MAMYSHSKLERFRNCPRKFYYHDIAKVRLENEPEQIATFLGSRVHESLEFLYKAVSQAKTPELNEVLEHYQANWRDQWSKSIVLPEGRTVREFQVIGNRCLRDYYARHTPFDESRVIGLEQRIVFPLDEKKTHQIQGYVDRLARKADGTWQIHDYKTNSRLPTQAHKDADPQLAFYEIGVRQMWRDVEQVDMVWHFLQFDVQIISRRSDDQLEVLKQETLETISEIESRPRTEAGFPTQESHLCNYCEYQSVCPVRKHLFEVRKLPPGRFAKEPGVKLVSRWEALAEQKQELAESQRALDAEIEEIQQALLAFASKKGLEHIVGNEKEAVVKHETAVQFPRKTFEAEEYANLEKALRDSKWWEQLSNLDRSALGRLWQDRENIDRGLLSILKRFATEHEAVSIRLRNRKP